MKELEGNNIIHIIEREKKKRFSIDSNVYQRDRNRERKNQRFYIILLIKKSI